MTDLIIVGDRVLLEAQDGEKQTDAGLLLPATVTEKEKVGTGRVVRVGPGHVMPNPEYSEGEPWTERQDSLARDLPLQAQPGDFAYYLRNESIEIDYQGKTYYIVQHNAILALSRPDPQDISHILEDLFDET
ncbi:MAG: co-chaperone GroES [Candidatus Latescibacteria bacterium]|nr:co-chaperone GroES [Candidatus Latescibacterota bacterium]